MADYFIGDVHGCYAEMLELVAELELNPDDKLFFAGDLVNRGPESLETLRWVKDNNAKMVLGNHDLYLLACYFKAIPGNYNHTFHRVIASDFCSDLMEWLFSQPLYLDFSDHKLFLSHAGLYPGWSIAEAKALADEVCDFMRSKPIEFFKSMFGNDGISWEDAKGREQRYRFVVNAFTRMRYVTESGSLDFGSHKPPPHPVKELKPWYYYLPSDIDYKFAFGHWSALGGYMPAKNVIALDGGCVWGNELLSWQLQNDEWHSIKCCRD